MKRLVKKKDFLLSIFLIIFSLILLWQTYLLPKEQHILNSSKTLPYLLGAVLLVLSTILLVKGFNETTEYSKKQFSKIMILNGIFYIVITMLYIFVGIPLVGFIYSSLIYMIVLMTYYGEVSWKWRIFVPVGSVVLIYLLFTKLLLVSLP